MFVWLFCNDFNFEVNSLINRCLQGFSTGVKPVVKFAIVRKCIKPCGVEFGTFFERVYMYSSLSENSLLVFFLNCSNYFDGGTSFQKLVVVLVFALESNTPNRHCLVH